MRLRRGGGAELDRWEADGETAGAGGQASKSRLGPASGWAKANELRSNPEGLFGSWSRLWISSLLGRGGGVAVYLKDLGCR